MDEAGSLLKNPWVWGGAAALVIAYVVFSGGSKGGGSAGYAQANLDLVAQQAQISGAIEQDQIAADTANTATVSATIGNLINSMFAYKLGSQQVAAGIKTTQIASDTAKYIEHAQVVINGANVKAALAAHRSDNLVTHDANVIQARTATDIANIQAASQQSSQISGLIGDIFKSIGL